MQYPTICVGFKNQLIVGRWKISAGQRVVFGAKTHNKKNHMTSDFLCLSRQVWTSQRFLRFSSYYKWYFFCIVTTGTWFFKVSLNYREFQLNVRLQTIKDAAWSKENFPFTFSIFKFRAFKSSWDIVKQMSLKNTEVLKGHKKLGRNTIDFSC